MSRRILIIEDEPDIREVAAASLELTRGWEVLTAPSGPTGVQRARLEQPDAILLDVMMPGMDGTETFGILRGAEDTTGIPVILMTAKVQRAERERFAAMGVDGLIPKPFDPMTLGDEIDRLLGWSA